MFEHSIKKLNSGLTTILIPMPGVESVTTLVLVNTGSRYERPKEEGVAHFFEHMVFKGTENYKDSKTLASAIDAIGANFNAFTGKEYTGYYVKSASRHIELALDVVSDMILKPKLRQKDIDRERGVIIEELNMYQDNPMSYVGQLFEQMFFRGSGLSHDIVGSKNTINSLDRADFISFLRQWYGLGNMVLIIAGNADTVSSSKTLKLAEEMFSKEPDKVRPKDKADRSQMLSKISPVSSDKLVLEKRTTEQAHLILGWPSIGRHDEKRYALNLLSIIMGGNMSSRLFTEVREKRGLCYYVRSDNDMYHDAGVFGASAGVDPGRIEEALTVIKKEFQDVASSKKAITKEELSAAKEYVDGNLTLGMEDSQGVAQYYGMRLLLRDEIETPQEYMEKLRSIKLKEVNELASELIRDREMRLSVIGPYGQKEKESIFQKMVE